MENIEITAYLKTYCGWSNGVRAVLAKYDISLQEKDIIKNPEYPFRNGTAQRPAAFSLRELSTADARQTSAAKNLRRYLLESGLVGSSEKTTDIPLNAPCSDEQHEAMIKMKL